MSAGRAKVRGSKVLSCRNTASRKKHGAWWAGRSLSILDMSVEGFMSPVRGRFAIASGQA